MTERTLEDVVNDLRKQFGERILMHLDDEPMHVPSISTGSLSVDRALGVGGVPRSRITEIFGPEGGGKTTLAQHIVAEAQNLKTIIPSLGLSKTALVFINQTRMKIGVMYGNPETTPGGVALRFYSSVRMRVARKRTLGSRGNEHGICVGVKVMKNKVAPPWQTAEFDIEWGK